MPEFVLAYTQQWIKHFASEGHDPRPLAAGVEGAIYDLGGGLVAKVWRDRRPDELVCMQSLQHLISQPSLRQPRRRAGRSTTRSGFGRHKNPQVTGPNRISERHRIGSGRVAPP
jgi:hypothetical protein